MLIGFYSDWVILEVAPMKRDHVKIHNETIINIPNHKFINIAKILITFILFCFLKTLMV